ncbi:putative chalcone--flavonone isomerase 3 [Prunus yedoensis var. nudiflora]|uniref:Putative chalcone--flavonone isomerase 3 n=1 Tax=Prunus yedoensis var. nudiflora TaxID=2094558 RepID=A0A314UFZ2_PRUYE|nr:putative chalcone--flavonone isomerase 3 [Prunus yedoensis var. nudiflora]
MMIIHLEGLPSVGDRLPANHTFKTHSHTKMGTEVVLVDEVPFPSQITTTKPLSLLGHGITDIEIHFLQIKFTAIGVYLDPKLCHIFNNGKPRKQMSLQKMTSLMLLFLVKLQYHTSQSYNLQLLF